MQQLQHVQWQLNKIIASFIPVAVAALRAVAIGAMLICASCPVRIVAHRATTSSINHYAVDVHGNVADRIYLSHYSGDAVRVVEDRPVDTM